MIEDTLSEEYIDSIIDQINSFTRESISISNMNQKLRRAYGKKANEISKAKLALEQRHEIFRSNLKREISTQSPKNIKCIKQNITDMIKSQEHKYSYDKSVIEDLSKTVSIFKSRNPIKAFMLKIELKKSIKDHNEHKIYIDTLQKTKKILFNDIQSQQAVIPANSHIKTNAVVQTDTQIDKTLQSKKQLLKDTFYAYVDNLMYLDEVSVVPDYPEELEYLAESARNNPIDTTPIIEEINIHKESMHELINSLPKSAILEVVNEIKTAEEKKYEINENTLNDCGFDICAITYIDFTYQKISETMQDIFGAEHKLDHAIDLSLNNCFNDIPTE